MKTLRSQLHARRTTLNEQIGKEDLILQGSKKLVGASHDHKTKDQASLEMSFAESKIKALQAELAKINSSLHAYQAERFVNRVVFRRIPSRRNHSACLWSCIVNTHTTSRDKLLRATCSKYRFSNCIAVSKLFFAFGMNYVRIKEIVNYA